MSCSDKGIWSTAKNQTRQMEPTIQSKARGTPGQVILIPIFQLTSGQLTKCNIDNEKAKPESYARSIRCVDLCSVSQKQRVHVLSGVQEPPKTFPDWQLITAYNSCFRGLTLSQRHTYRQNMNAHEINTLFWKKKKNLFLHIRPQIKLQKVNMTVSGNGWGGGYHKIRSLSIL